MAQQQQQSGGGDNSLAPVWITVLIMIACYFIWVKGQRYIVSFVFTVSLVQAKAVLLFYKTRALEDVVYLMQTIDPATVSWNQLMQLSGMVGYYIRYPIIAILLVLALYLYKSNLKLKYRTVHSMKSLRAQEQHNWPAIMPVVKEDLTNTDVNIGPWAMALTPMEFARKYDLLRKEDKILDEAMPGLEMTAGIRKGDAKRVFTLQLGPYWDGFDRCPPHVAALAAVFIARMNRDRSAATKILKEIDQSYVAGKPDYSSAKPVLSKYKNIESVREIIHAHAYMLTTMASLLEAARLDGVLPCSEFLWLKPVDRRLWYMLNCVGRQTPFAEVGGPFAHWKAERALGRRSLMPMVEEASKALEIAIREVKLSPKELKELKP